ncbi:MULTISPECIES: N-acetyltransferase [unclassified Sphingobacterium]|uniref:N-acetyltransferase n=1 Tax=unclassified Sphingobacterium TaxID=2609468 RepID=UPI0025F8FCAF|nr:MULTISPECIES: N-acetyltransferase [unclassified Sphingobacterium]
MDILTKFALATDETVDMLLDLIHELASEKFSSMVDQMSVKLYMEKYYDRKYFISEMNSMSNQWLIVYVDEKAVGYAKVTSRGNVPQSLKDMRAIRIGDFSVLKKFTHPEVLESLFHKCQSLCNYVDAIWINEYVGNPMIEFFESKGFQKEDGPWEHDEIALPSVCLIHINGHKEGKNC